RQYDPRVGRWWSNDPVTFPGRSPYEAMASNPIGMADPFGDCPEGDENCPSLEDAVVGVEYTYDVGRLWEVHLNQDGDKFWHLEGVTVLASRDPLIASPRKGFNPSSMGIPWVMDEFNDNNLPHVPIPELNGAELTTVGIDPYKIQLKRIGNN